MFFDKIKSFFTKNKDKEIKETSEKKETIKNKSVVLSLKINKK